MWEVSQHHLVYIVVASGSVYVTVLILIRSVGLVSFSKIGSFDFASTIAIGSLIASAVMPTNITLAEGLIAIASLFGLQAFHSWGRSHAKGFKEVSENSPIFLFRNGTFLDRNIQKVNLTKEDLYAKCREANAANLLAVDAIVFEGTGDISVIHNNDVVDPNLYSGVRVE